MAHGPPLAAIPQLGYKIYMGGKAASVPHIAGMKFPLGAFDTCVFPR